MILGANATYTAVPGTTIHMTGSSFENHATQPGQVRGLSSTALQFEGGTADADPFEIAGYDFGVNGRGFHANFVLDVLHLGGSDVGHMQLVDLADNRPYWPTASQAIYVNELVLGTGSMLDLNGLNLYYRTLIYNGGQLFNGSVQHVNDVWLLGDANSDGVVDVTDLGMVGGSWHTSAILPDVNHDGRVDIADLALVGANWSPSDSTSAAGESMWTSPGRKCILVDKLKEWKP